MWCFRGAVSCEWHCQGIELLKEVFQGGGLFSLGVFLRAAALTAWTSQSCCHGDVSVCSYVQSSPCCMVLQDDDHAYVVTEVCHGGDLEQFLQVRLLAVFCCCVLQQFSRC